MGESFCPISLLMMMQADDVLLQMMDNPFAPSLLHFVAIEIVQEAVRGQSVVVVAVHVDGGQFLGGLVGRVCEPCQQ